MKRMMNTNEEIENLHVCVVCVSNELYPTIMELLCIFFCRCSVTL